MTDDTEVTTMVEFGEEECLSLIGEEGVGRVGFAEGRDVFVYPVNYVRDNHGIAFRTDTGSHLYRTSTSSVAFEVDATHEESR